MIEKLRDFIEDGRIQLWTCDGIDEETFFSHDTDIRSRMNRHDQYFAIISVSGCEGFADRVSNTCIH
jgi:esterase/lipase superfamily enzyme